MKQKHAKDFAQQLVQWQRQHGRHDLPWQNTRNPYRVWLSEIMLQQTQVATVKGYFARFLQRFPDVQSLAAASLDDVLGLWSGLGYYSRARNLHRCAQQVVEHYGGAFPQDAQTLATLPGIGPSTAAAISSLCFDQRVAILDANVKRVVSRIKAMDVDVSQTAHARALWQAASSLLPAPQRARRDMVAYTQGMMDLGATLCTPKNPVCLQCPVQNHCSAASAGDPERYPVPKRKVRRSSQSLWLLWAQTAQGAVWLSQRPTPGVWAGLYCLPLFDSEHALLQALPANARSQMQPQASFVHVLTHKDLHLHPCKAVLPQKASLGEGRWFSPTEWPSLGLPAPVRKLLEQQ